VREREREREKDIERGRHNAQQRQAPHLFARVVCCRMFYVAEYCRVLECFTVSCLRGSIAAILRTDLTSLTANMSPVHVFVCIRASV